MAPKGMVRLHRFSLSEVLPHIGKVQHNFYIPEQKRNVCVKHLSNFRMNLLARTQQCAACWIKGDHFWLERSGYFPFHFNLYGPNMHGHPTLMTMDHFLPKSKGGNNNPDNLQLLCERCNRGKKNLMISNADILRTRFKGDSHNILFSHMKRLATSEAQIENLKEIHATRFNQIVEQDISCYPQHALSSPSQP